MKSPSRRNLLLLTAALAVSVVLYNTWSYCCGRCTRQAFFTLGPAGAFLLSLNAAMAAVLLVLHWRNRRRRRHQACACGRLRAPDWAFCPHCGERSE